MASWVPGSPLAASDGPVSGGFAITPSDTAVLSPIARGFTVDVAGNIKVRFIDQTTDTFAVNAGTPYPYTVDMVFATGTTATGIHGVK